MYIRLARDEVSAAEIYLPGFCYRNIYSWHHRSSLEPVFVSYRTAEMTVYIDEARFPIRAGCSEARSLNSLSLFQNKTRSFLERPITPST